jgi:hypothetical protein
MVNSGVVHGLGFVSLTFAVLGNGGVVIIIIIIMFQSFISPIGLLTGSIYLAHYVRVCGRKCFLWFFCLLLFYLYICEASELTIKMCCTRIWFRSLHPTLSGYRSGHE